LRVLLLAFQVGDQGVGSLHSEEDGCTATNARVTTSDDSLASLELAGRLVELGTTIPGGNMVVDGLRVKVRLLAGERLVLDLGLPA
jgi:hypothetical protein